MPVFDTSKRTKLNYTVYEAQNMLARLVGLIGTAKPDKNQAYYIKPCRGVHTFGMKYPVDVVFLDSDRKVVKLIENLLPNKMTQMSPVARSVLELPSGTLKKDKIRTGDHLKVKTDHLKKADLAGLGRLLHWPANFFIAILWSNLVLSSFVNWQTNGGILSLGIVILNTFLLLLFFSRRESTEISNRLFDWLIPIATVGLSMRLQPNPALNSTLNDLSLGIQFVGILAIAVSLLNLGRSFGVIPANRKIKNGGFYKRVRHPLYSSEMLFYFGFLLGNLSAFNFFAVALILAGQIYRAVSEEKLLSRESKYLDYMQSVRYRFVPGIF